MLILPIATGILQNGDDLASILCTQAKLENDDIVVISSKAVATVEGAAIDLTTITPSEEAKQWEKKCHRPAAFYQAVMDEAKRLHGTILSDCPHALLTEVTPTGLAEGSLLVPNAGLDLSNIEEGRAIGWPLDPLASVIQLRASLEKISGKRLAVIISDSCCRPRRIGVTAFALTVAGIDPVSSQVGKEDLFGKKLTMTTEAVADQWATAANALMGNADQATPAAIIRAHGQTLSAFAGWVPGIQKEHDLFRGAL